MRTLFEPSESAQVRAKVHAEHRSLHVVTGASGYTGRYISSLLLARGERVLTLTGHPHRRNPFGDRVAIAPYNFEYPQTLATSLRGASTLINTYWVRFTHGPETYEKAIEHSLALFQAAKTAGVKRIVHISVTNPSENSPFPYFRGKAQVEKALIESGLSYAIIRPTLIFGTGDILINNIAWLLRRFPAMAIPGSGLYRLQPVFVEDVARMVVDAAMGYEDVIIDAAGPEVFSFNELVALIATTVRSRARLIRTRPKVALLLSRVIGLAIKDVLITEDEIGGLMANLLVSNAMPTGWTRVSDWLRQNANIVGVRYASELERHYV